MSLRVHTGRNEKRGVYGLNYFPQEKGLEPIGRITPKGRVHKYRTIRLLGKLTKVPIQRLTDFNKPAVELPAA